MATWCDLEREAPEIAAAGRRRLVGADGVAIAFLATADQAGMPHLSPVCPIFCDADLYLSAGTKTPKVRDVRATGRYVLHGFLGPSDEEFQVSGRALEVADQEERARVHAAIPFAAFQRSDPIFRLGIERALWVYWEKFGQPGTRSIRRRWPESI